MEDSEADARGPGPVAWLRGAMPSAEQTLLLRACLLPAPAAQSSLDAWLERVGDPAESVRASPYDSTKAVLPLLAASLESRGLAAPAALRTLVRTARMREELRTRRLEEIAGRAFQALDAAGLDFVLVGGLALAASVYPASELRHSALVRLLMRDADQSRLEGVLAAVGFASWDRGGDAPPAWLHPSGVGLYASEHIAVRAFPKLEQTALGERAERQRVAGASVRILGPSDALLAICAEGCNAGRGRSLQWVCDARLLLEGRPALDWEDFLASARASWLSAPAAAALAYVGEALEAPVPSAVLRELRGSAIRAHRAEREVVLQTARTGTPLGLAGVLRGVRGPGDARELLRLSLLPSREFLERAYGASASHGVVRLHLRRLRHFAARFRARMARELRRLIPRRPTPGL